MATGLGTLSLWVDADTHGLHSNLKGARETVESFSRTGVNAFALFSEQAGRSLSGIESAATDLKQSIKSIGEIGSGIWGKLAAGAGAVGVAIAGWEIGKKIAEMAELEEKFGKWFFNTDQLENYSKAQDDAINKRNAEHNARMAMLKDAENAMKWDLRSIDEANTDIDPEAQLEAEARRQKELQDAQDDFERKRKQSIFDAMTNEEKLNALYEERKKVMDDIQSGAYDKPDEYKARGQLLDIEKQIDSVKKKEPKRGEGVAESSVVAAVQRGSAEAMRIENSRVSSQSKIEENTRATARGIDKLIKAVHEIGVDSTPVEMEDAFT